MDDEKGSAMAEAFFPFEARGIARNSETTTCEKKADTGNEFLL
jgi:hypothetical protein